MTKTQSTGLTILAAALLASACWAGAEDAWVRFSEDARTIVVNAVGISEFKAVSSVVYELNGNNHRLATAGHDVISPVCQTTTATPFGDAETSTATYGAQDSPYQLTVTLKRLASLRAFTMQAVFHNRGAQDVNLRAFDLLDLRKGLGGSFAVDNAADWLATPLMKDFPAVSLAESAQSFGEAAIIYHADGHGFLAGPVGPAEAYTGVDIRDQTLNAWVQMDNILVRAGESRRSEEIIFCFEPIATATDIWTRWVAATHGVRRHKGPVYGWCSWYDRTTKIDAAHVLDVTQTIARNPNTFGKGVIQIDDGYQKMDGDWSANEKFPGGMADLAKRIREAGCVPGVWFAPLMIHPELPWAKQNPDAIQKNAKGIASFMNANPFHPAGANWVNPSHPKSKPFLFNIIRDARDRGYGYIKIDFNGIGNRFADATKTRLQVFRELYALYREAAGEEMYILSCLGSPTRGVIGFVDAARIGPDSHPAHFDKCLKSVLRFQIYDNVWWRNDPDVTYLAQSLASRNLGPTPQGEGMWRTWHNTVALVGGTTMTSEPINQPDAREQWHSFEIMRPGSREPARLLTLGKPTGNAVFGFAASRPYGDFAVYNLYNPTKESKPISLSFDRAGLPAGRDCAVFDFWQNRVVAYAKDLYHTGALEPHSSALLRFTPLNGEGPTLVGSNLHLSIGATEITGLRIGPTKIEIELSDAGAQRGSLTFHSRKPLAAAASEGCAITSIEDLGDNLRRVNVAGRKWRLKQSLTLTIGDPDIPQLTETPAQREQRLAWFRDAKFGLFIHWGPAAISGQEISWGMDGRIEGGEKHKKVPRDTYMNLYKDFNPVKFNPDELLGLANKAGMKYFVFVAKHHDGFCLWPTRQKRFPEAADYPVHYSIADTPYPNDPTRMMQQAARKHGFRIGWYYSTRDWTHPDYLQGDNRIYNDYYENQVEELLRDYGPVDILWFDHCFGTWDQYTIPRLYRKLYAQNPKLLVNNRAAKGLRDVPGEFSALLSGDYDTPENRMGAFQHGRAWESCMILSPHVDHGGWSYRPDATTRSLGETLRLLSSCVTGDGNMLLNLAPLPDGSIRAEERAILEGIAPWIAKHGEAIYGTRGGPWINGSWGGSTYRGRTVYLHVFEPGDAPLILNRLPQEVVSATTSGGKPIAFSNDSEQGTVSIILPPEARDPHVSIVRLTLNEDVKGVLYRPALAGKEAAEVPGTLTFLPKDAECKGVLQAGEGESGVLHNWVNPADTASWPLEIDSPGTYTVQLTTSATEPGVILTVLCGNKKHFHARVPVTGSEKNFQTYDLGTVTFPNTESFRLLLRPANHPSWKPVQVRRVNLIPSN